MSDDGRHLIIDNGSGFIKAGFAGEHDPQNVFPTIEGVPGEETENPITCGIIENWEDMEKVWHHTFYNKLNVKPEEHSIFLTEPPLNPKMNREITAHTMFETFQARKVYLGNTSVMSLYATGNKTGIVVDSGYGVSHIVPIYMGYALPDATLQLDMAGSDLNYYLANILSDRGHNFSTRADINNVSDIKEKMCYVAADIAKEKAMQGADLERKYTLPDGQVITMGDERFRCPEPLFKPSLMGIMGIKANKGMHTLTHDSIQKCEYDIRNKMYGNIVLSGGNTMFEGLADRMKAEMTSLAPSSVEVKIVAPPGRKDLTWIGSAILASLSTFDDMWITKEDYEECGPAFVHRKCV